MGGLTWQVVQHVGEQFLRAVRFVVDVHELLLQRIAHEAEYDEVEQLADLVRQYAQKVVVQQQLPKRRQDNGVA